MSAPAFAPPAAAPRRPAEVAAGVCARQAERAAAIARHSAAARAAWDAELASLRTSTSAPSPQPAAPLHIPRAPARVLTGPEAVLAARLKRIIGQPAVLIPESPEEQRRVADEAIRLERYRERMARYGIAVPVPVVHTKHVHDALKEEVAEQPIKLVPLKQRISDIVRFAAGPAKAAESQHEPRPIFRKRQVRKPVVNTPSVTHTPPPPAPVNVARAAPTPPTKPPVATSAAASTAAGKQTAQEPLSDQQNVGVERPNLVDAVVRTVQKWMSNLQQPQDTDKDEGTSAPQQAASAAVGAAQVLAALFSLDK